MSEQIRILAEFCGGLKPHLETFLVEDLHTKTWRVFYPFTDANDTLLVEARLREKGQACWHKYLKILMAENFGLSVWAADKCMAATLEQRMKAAGKVIQESNDE